ncbi:MAG: circularly permuted type 2 ATP-grasp protein, partial [Pseudomonadota bacterium]|nr:circularly permuted type 2 ATP-grasp protein [Pseudomonadota bacterium]
MPAWDEMANGRGGLRPGWSTVFAAIASLGPDGLTRRADVLDRMLAEDGVTALLPGVAPKGWRCDPLPLLISAADFERLEAGLAQRAKLIEHVLQDVYGRQDLLAEGLIPPAAVYANPAFLRPCRVADRRPGQQLMHLYAAELLRDPDGRWQVIADRTADAAGSAYALENRRALNRAIPELFRGQPPRRISPFFAAWQDMLHLMAPAGTDRPGLALLTPGSDDKLWYEHVVLARELSCTLVESSDLSLRDGALFLKTLSGLQRVDVLLRRQDGRTLDPLELEATVHLGVTGLLDAARSGNVRIVNDPGTGCLEAPLWAAMLPRIAQRMIGEKLLLASPDTLWLGDHGALARVAAAPEHWRIRPALDGMGLADGSNGAAGMLERAVACPGDFVAVAKLRPSLAPCLAPDGLRPQPVLVRMFMMFDGTRWQALPGGFGRVLTRRDMDETRLPLHALCKDVWIANEDEV